MIATFPFDVDCTGRMQAPRRACVPAVSGLDEGQQVGVDLILMRGREACPKLCGRVEGQIEETLTSDRLPRQHLII
jgi:hypothetical protein